VSVSRFSLLLCSLVFSSIIVSAGPLVARADVLLYDSGATVPANGTGSFNNLAGTAVVAGTLGYVNVALASTVGGENTNFAYYLFDPTNTFAVDCRTATTTGAALGAQSGFSPASTIPVVSINFTGTQCDVVMGAAINVNGFSDLNVYAVGTAAGTQIFSFWQGDAPDLSTRIIETIPGAGSTIATSTIGTVGAEVNINASDFSDSGFRDWRILQSLILPNGAGQDLATSLIVTYVSDSGITSTSTTKFANGSTISFEQIGRYSLRTDFQRPRTDFLSFIPGFYWQTMDSTTTVFTVSTTTNAQKLFDQFTQDMQNFSSNASSTISLGQCLALSIAGCFSYMFVPNTQTLAQFTDLGAELGNKPPFGYWGAVRDLLATSTASTTPAGYLLGASAVYSWFAVFILGLGSVINLVLIVFIFKRISMWDWHQ